jgi:hypothetical protein
MKEIDRQIVALVPIRNIARRFHLSDPSVMRHRDGHLIPRLAEAMKREENLRSADLIASARDRTLDLERIGRKAEKSRKLATAIGAIREVRRHDEFIGRLRGDLEEGPFVPPPSPPGPTFQGVNLILAKVPNDSAIQLELVAALRALESLFTNRSPSENSQAAPDGGAIEEASVLAR